MDIVFRLLVAGFVVVAPSALFVAFYRGLERMRDDNLVDRVLERVDDPTGGRRDPATVLTGGMVGGGSGGPVACGDCGALNPGYADYCARCLESLE
jgi:hypothetical protein